MKKNVKNWIMTVAIYAIVFCVFNMLAFVLPLEHRAVFWLSYVFMCLAFVVQFVSMILAFKNSDIDAMFMGIPLASLSFFYFFAAIFVGAVFMIFQMAPFKLALVLQILIVVIYAVIAIIAIMSRGYVSSVNENIKQSVQDVKRLTVNVDVLIPQVSDMALQRALKRVSETIKYSDPISTNAVADLDMQIQQTVNALRINIENGNNTVAIQICKDIEVLYLQRNSLLKTSK